MTLTPDQQRYEADMIAHHTPEELVRKLSEAKQQIEQLQSQLDAKQGNGSNDDKLVNDQKANNNQVQPGLTPHNSAQQQTAQKAVATPDDGPVEPDDAEEPHDTGKKKKR